MHTSQGHWTYVGVITTILQTLKVVQFPPWLYISNVLLIPSQLGVMTQESLPNAMVKVETLLSPNNEYNAVPNRMYWITEDVANKLRARPNGWSDDISTTPTTTQFQIAWYHWRWSGILEWVPALHHCWHNETIVASACNQSSEVLPTPYNALVEARQSSREFLHLSMCIENNSLVSFRPDLNIEIRKYLALGGCASYDFWESRVERANMFLSDLSKFFDDLAIASSE